MEEGVSSHPPGRLGGGARGGAGSVSGGSGAGRRQGEQRAGGLGVCPRGESKSSTGVHGQRRVAGGRGESESAPVTVTAQHLCTDARRAVTLTLGSARRSGECRQSKD